MGCDCSVERDWPPLSETMAALTGHDLNKGQGVIQMPPGHGIDCSVTEVLDLCLSKFDTPQEKQALQSFAQVVGMILRFEATTLANGVSHAYRLCSPSVAGQRIRQQMRQDGRGAELEEIQTQFVEQFCQVLRAADYCAVSRGEWEIAATESFMFGLPVTVDWDCYDGRVLGRFLGRHPRLREHMPPWSDRILVFRQGSSVATISRWMFVEKAKRLLYLLVVQPALQLAARLVGLRQRLRELEFPLTPRSPRSGGAFWGSGSALDALWDFASSPAKLSKLGGLARRKLLLLRKGRPTPLTSEESLDDAAEAPMPQSAPPAAGTTPDDAPTSQQKSSLWFLASHPRPRVLTHRVGLPRALPTAWSVVQNFHRKVRLTEPTFKNVAVLYCHSLKGARRANNDRDLTEESDGIHIKLFRDIPMADLEVVFPFKRPGIRKRDLLKSGIAFLVGLWSAYKKLKDGWTAGVMRGIVALLATRSVAAIGGLQRAKVKMEREIHRTYVHKNRDNDEGALYYLLDWWQRQELREMLLAYTYCAVLQEEAPAHRTRRGVRIEEIRTVVEAELQDRLHLTTDFNVGNAIEKLEQHGVVQRRGRLLSPAPIADALANVRRRWATYLQACSDLAAAETPGPLLPH
eukprot:EG_transcript_4716